MFEFMIFVVLICTYFVINHRYLVEIQAILAMVLMAVYLLLYLFIPPQISITTAQIAKGFTMVPMLAFGAILFPQASRKMPSETVRILGWIGLI